MTGPAAFPVRKLPWYAEILRPRRSLPPMPAA